MARATTAPARRPSETHDNGMTSKQPLKAGARNRSSRRANEEPPDQRGDRAQLGFN
jgi:hypothetical protein